MLALRWCVLSIFSVSLLLALERSCVEAAEKKATIQGTRQANMRVGPGMDQGIKGILKENEPFTIEGQDGEWYLVETPTGQKGYVHKSVVKLASENAPAVFTEPDSVKDAVTQSKDPNKPSPTDAPVSEAAQPASTATSTTTPGPAANPTQTAPVPAAPGQPAGLVRKPDDRRTLTSKSPSLIELLEGRETDMMIWAGIAFGFFLLGWICGGKYSLRRDRVRRNKLRF